MRNKREEILRDPEAYRQKQIQNKADFFNESVKKSSSQVNIGIQLRTRRHIAFVDD